MIALIVCIIVFSLGILFLILLWDDIEGYAAFPIGLIIVSIVALIISLCSGSSVKNREEKLLRDRHKIEILLEEDLCQDTINDAESYNKKVDAGNNYWCRFSIEDREYLKIDIDSYIKARKGVNNGSN